MMRYYTLIPLLAIAFLPACGSRDAGKVAASDPGAALVQNVCKDCHGPNGQGQGRFPRLAGRSAEELATLLRQYKSGHKSVNMSDTMRPFAQALSDQQIDQVAAYLAAQ
ncbi:c-type cytochrome [Parasulfuritortus cantonensis]|uniref:C-type cytochrome n=1 Tax=Parasulfuritortus cantonensis TaxID=2528202 RepID=A0A4V2NW54_9PROT|nr:c-type cytochrome [Parasulfuritortus cantonensis]TCJ15972.1 c-type cytochrome [Parasulfuritortus cantonensis]